jgi:tetratricopeptide (TPR) repeat protein
LSSTSLLALGNALYYFSLGQMAIQQGNFAQADSLFEIAQQLDSGSREIIKERLAALYFLQDYQKIIELGKDAISKGMDDEDIIEIVAESYVQIGDLKNAQHFFEKAVKISEENKGRLYFNLYEVAMKQGNIGAAKKYLEKSENYAGADAKILYRIAMVYGEQQEDEKFVSTLKRLLLYQPDHLQANLMLGNYYFREKEYETALEYLESAKENAPFLPVVSTREMIFSYYFTRQYNKVLMYEKDVEPSLFDINLRKIFLLSAFFTDQYNTALKYGEQILAEGDKLEPDIRDQTLEIMALAEYRLSNYENAYILFSQIQNEEFLFHNLTPIATISQHTKKGELLERTANFLEKKEGNILSSPLRVVTAHFYALNDSLQKADSLLQSIDPQTIDDDNLINLLAYTYLKVRNDTATAMMLLEKSMDVSTSPTLWFGNYYATEKEYEKAIPYLEEAIQSEPDRINTYFLLASMYHEIGDIKSEIALLESAIDRFPDNAELLNWLGYTLADNNMRLYTALKLLKKAVSLDSDNLYIWDSLAWAYYKIGDYQRALKAMKPVIDNEMQDTTVRYHLGNIYWKLGNTEKARENWELAIKIDNNSEARRKAEEMLSNILSIDQSSVK